MLGVSKTGVGAGAGARAEVYLFYVQYCSWLVLDKPFCLRVGL